MQMQARVHDASRTSHSSTVRTVLEQNRHVMRQRARAPLPRYTLHELSASCMRPSAGFFDAHCHLQDPRLGHCLDSVLQDAGAADIRYAVVNGTHEGDWPAVLNLCSVPCRASAGREQRSQPWALCCCLPSFGLHPWFLSTRSATWLDRLEAALVAQPRAAVGEVGLHFSASCPAGADEQASVLGSQLQLAARLRRPVSVHCVGPGAAQRLCSELQKAAPAGGFEGLLVHGFSGEPHWATRFQALGAHLSFSAANTRQKTLALLQVAENRLVLESDAPDGLLPAGNIESLAFAPSPPGGCALRLGSPGCMCVSDSCDLLLQPPGRPRPLNTPVRALVPNLMNGA